MLVAYFIMRNCRNSTKESLETTSMKWKRRSLLSNVLCVMFACYFFYRHNKYCEPLGKSNIGERNGSSEKLINGPILLLQCTLCSH